MKQLLKNTSPFLPDQSKRISIREYIRNYKIYNEDVCSTGTDIIITNQDEDVVRITPAKSKKKWTIEDFKKMRFKGGGKNLSKDIDKIVYGV